MANNTLHSAKSAKKDEFYTQLSDIANELRHYREFFRGKTVFCNCDDPFESNFFKYFALNFNAFGLRKLIATCYDGSPVQGRELPLFGETEDKTAVRTPHKIEITEIPDTNSDGATDLADVEWLLRNDKNVLTRLHGNGDFRSAECVELLREADVVVTNPPFSLFREYVAQLIAYDKKFLIVGHQNAITYKEIFPLIKENKIWLGYGFKGGAAHFYSHYKDIATAGDHREGMIRVSGVNWFTNIDTNKRHEELILYKKYNPEEYPKYDNYNAINVDKVADIPCDYDGVMGVPITFLDKYNPEQFEIVGCTESEGRGLSNGVFDSLHTVTQPVIRGEERRGEERRGSPTLQTNIHQTCECRDTDIITERESTVKKYISGYSSATSIPGLMNNPKDTMVGGKSKYARITIRKIKNINR